METWFVPNHMKELANKSTKNFGYDQSGTVEYCFNQFGFRNDFNAGPSINVIGNSISFGIGVDAQQTFGHILSQKIGLPYNNFGFGCYLHENHDYLSNIKILVNQNPNNIYIIQINNLDRYRNANTVICGLDPSFARTRFLDYFDQLLSILSNQRVLIMYWDDQDYELPEYVTKKISILNKFHIDIAIKNRSDTFGIQSHNAIAKTLFSLYRREFN